MPVFASTEIAQFKRSMREALDSLISRGEEFTVDDIWKELTLRGIEGRAPDPAIVGATLNSYRKRGVINNTGRSLISQRGPAKGRRISIWRVTGRAA